MELMDGKKVRDVVLEDLQKKISKEIAKIGLAIIYIGNNSSSDIYIKNKLKYAEQVGINAKLYHLDENVSKDEVVELINGLNNDSNIHGIILQSPIPNHLDFNYLSGLILANKDVDGFTKDNVFGNYINEKTILPCTVKGICYLLDFYKIDVTGLNVVIVGRSMIVGKPLSLAMLNKNATVTIAHSKTKDLKSVCLNADVLIVAVGKPNLIKEDYVKSGAVVIDVGINKVDGVTCGDVDFNKVKDRCSYITPVPGGVGPMTVAMLLENVYEAYKEAKNG